MKKGYRRLSNRKALNMVRSKSVSSIRGPSVLLNVHTQKGDFWEIPRKKAPAADNSPRSFGSFIVRASTLAGFSHLFRFEQRGRFEWALCEKLSSPVTNS